jgi:hypothetical protein
LSSPGSTEGAGGTDDSEGGEAFRSSPLPAAAIPGAGAAGVEAESSGKRRVLALPVSPLEELLRVWVLAARAAVPVRRIPTIDSARAAFVFMFQR